MTLEAILVWVIVGAIAGWLASLLIGANRSQGLLADIVIGIVGGVLGGFLLDRPLEVVQPAISAYGFQQEAVVSGITLTSVVVAFFGAIILIAILRAVRTL
jgi:uncharacterized membrane protein YeaQ/YmgE (transglycosylase-associated protein family)